MAKVKNSQDNFIFGLDIGTRSIVGTVGFLQGDKFHVVAQYVKEHDSRAMIDGQIHDIAKVGESIRLVKEELENEMSITLTDCCIAAAGRVLRTINVDAEKEFETEKEITSEDIYNLLMDGIEKAYAEFGDSNDTGLKFYCVGYTPMYYYMNGYSINNLEGHKAKKIGVSLIATFLPDDVVDGLYKSVEFAGLNVSNLTLEPIAAIQVAIPEKFRMLNLALVDVGAGTSDISITNDGTIVAYGMIPSAGDGLTNIIVQNLLVDFDTAEVIKRKANGNEIIEYEDILGLPQTTTPEAILEMLDEKIDEMTDSVAEEIKRLNGNKSVSAVFVVGGGGTVKGYTDKLSEKLGIQKERVAIRGSEVMQAIEFENNEPVKDSLMVTPIGICLSYYTQSNNFIFVSFNGNRLKLYDNGNLTVSDAAMQVSFPNEDLFPKRGKALNFTLNGKTKMIRGEQGDFCVININDSVADLHTKITSGDKIVITPSTAGSNAKATLSSLKELSEQLNIVINGKNVSLPKSASVNGENKDLFYEICDGDEIEINNFYTITNLGKILDLDFEDSKFLINGVSASPDQKVYEGFSLDFSVADFAKKEIHTTEINMDLQNENNDDYAVENNEDYTVENNEVEPIEEKKIHSLNIIVNDKSITLNGKKEYVFVDVFDYIDFDLKNPAGRSVVTKVNGAQAEYMQTLNEGDNLQIYWENN